MNQDTLLYTLPQWLVFGAIMVLVYGWVEDKKPFRLIGSSLFILLGFFAIYALSSAFLAGKELLTPEEVMKEELEDIAINEIPFQVKLIPAYWSFLVAALLSVPALFLDWKDKKRSRTFHILAGLVALAGFFIIVGAIKSI